MTQSMEQLAQRAVEVALQAGAHYADARIVRLSQEQLSVRNGRLAQADAPDDFGIGIRVLKDGCWGFAAAPSVARDLPDVLPGVARRAFKAARDLQAARTQPVRLAQEAGHVGEYFTPVEKDPFQVPLQEKVELLRAAEAAARVRSEVVVGEAMISLRREEQWQASSEGAQLHQVLMRVGGHVTATASAHGNVEFRSHPALGGQYLSGGWEHIEAMDLVGAAPRMGEEATALCSAPLCPEGEQTMILGGSQLALQIHESVGHPTEADRVFDHEIDFAGASFVNAETVGQHTYGSSLVNLEANSLLEHGLDTRGWDDDGVESQRWPIVSEGVLAGLITDREWAQASGRERSQGSSRAEGWYNPPIVRIPNLSLLPGDWDLQDLLKDTEDGALLVDGIRTWSIDQRRLNFQFTCQAAWEVQDGRPGRLLRRPTYQGNTPQFWGNCDAICGPEHFQVFGVPNCGKGNPYQIAEMSHGAAPARFRKVTFIQ